METKELKITCPEGEELCKTHPRKAGECYVNSSSSIEAIEATNNLVRGQVYDKNLLPSEGIAEAMLALCQLIQLRDCYNDGWLPIWNNVTFKYCIASQDNTLTVLYNTVTSYVLAFKSKELANQFIKNFYELLRIAEPLI